MDGEGVNTGCPTIKAKIGSKALRGGGPSDFQFSDFSYTLQTLNSRPSKYVKMIVVLSIKFYMLFTTSVAKIWME